MKNVLSNRAPWLSSKSQRTTRNCSVSSVPACKRDGDGAGPCRRRGDRAQSINEELVMYLDDRGLMARSGPTTSAGGNLAMCRVFRSACNASYALDRL